MDPRRRARNGARLIAVLAMAGLAMPAIVLASIQPPAAQDPGQVQAPPSDRPTPKPKGTPTPAPPTPPPPTPVPPTPTPAGATPPAATATPVAPPPFATEVPVGATPPPAATPAPLAAAPAAATAVPPPGPGAGATGAPAGSSTAAPGQSVDPLAPIGVVPVDPGSDGAPESGPVLDAGWLGFIRSLGAPIAYGAFVLFVALVIARRRLARGEAARATVPARNPDLQPLERLPRPDPRVADDEANLPRWLRPSLRAERMGIEAGTTRIVPAALQVASPARIPLAFGTPPEDADDRRAVRFGDAALLDAPDETGARTVARLEAGDEIEVLDADGEWLNVLTPTGLAGWLMAGRLGPRGAAERPDPTSLSPAPGSAEEPIDLAAILAAGHARHGATVPRAAGAGQRSPG